MNTYRDMTAAERLEWGISELSARKADLIDRSEDDLRRAQENAKRRRRIIGASRGDASLMVAAATRAERARTMQP